MPDQAQEDDKGWIDTYNQAYDALAARLSALEGERDTLGACIADAEGRREVAEAERDRLNEKVAALEGEKDEYLKRLDEVNVARQENEVRAILAERSVAALEGELAELRPLWHCTMEDKAAADAHFLALEGERDTALDAAREVVAAAEEVSRTNSRLSWVRFRAAISALRAVLASTGEGT